MEKSTDEPCCSKSSDSSSKENEDPWLIGLAKNAVLHVKCSALEENPENPPAHRLHMTYKTHQAETKLLNALLTAHGMRENLTDEAGVCEAAQLSDNLVKALDLWGIWSPVST
ncbi:hypothetical protein M8J76_012065 [Diaphorina citri]|nr:hypothetical protein M8J75_006117 [Diaphorina citri]KAI5741274.1 hypothetical protein M8J76_012065 [Diaphorina citri]